MTQNTPITKEGLVKLQHELDHLVKKEREQLKLTIQEARELGDLKENAEYHAAKEKQSQVEGRIMQLQGVIAKAQIINTAEIKSDKIVFGATVNLTEVDSGTSKTFKIVGEFESNKDEGRISFTSPLGKALIGKEEGDTVVVKAPKGDIEYEIESIEYL
jgi:transcription elongation factor GreA